MKESGRRCDRTLTDNGSSVPIRRCGMATGNVPVATKYSGVSRPSRGTLAGGGYAESVPSHPCLIDILRTMCVDHGQRLPVPLLRRDRPGQAVVAGPAPLRGVPGQEGWLALGGSGGVPVTLSAWTFPRYPPLKVIDDGCYARGMVKSWGPAVCGRWVRRTRTWHRLRESLGQRWAPEAPGGWRRRAWS